MGTKVNYTSTGVKDEDGNEDGGELFHKRFVRGEPMVETVKNNGSIVKYEIDSGSAVTVMK